MEEEISPWDTAVNVLIYAMAIAAALGFNSLVMTMFKLLDMKGANELVFKSVYVILMFASVMALTYITHTRVRVNV